MLISFFDFNNEILMEDYLSAEYSVYNPLICIILIIPAIFAS